jgi:hypothetical protein
MERKGNKEERKSSEGIPPEDVISDLPTSSSASHSHDPTKMSTKERMRRLQAICKEGKTPLSSKMSANQRCECLIRLFRRYFLQGKACGTYRYTRWKKICLCYKGRNQRLFGAMDARRHPNHGKNKGICSTRKSGTK